MKGPSTSSRSPSTGGCCREVVRDLDASRFVTLCCARWDAGRRELTYVNAGHPEPIARMRSARPVLLGTTGPLVSSALCDLPCEQATLALDPGDSLLFYTDGVTEARGPEGMFGQERLVAAALRGARRGPELLDGLLADVAAFSGAVAQRDDVTILSLDLAGA